MQHHASSATARGIPLFPGERVIYYEEESSAQTRIIYLIGGILMLPILVGFYLLYLAATSDESEAAIITTHRCIWVRGRDPSKTRVIAHGTLARASFDQDRRGLGITAVTLVDRNGQIIVFRTNYDSTRAHFIMNAAQAPAQLSQLPTVQYRP